MLEITYLAAFVFATVGLIHILVVRVYTIWNRRFSLNRLIGASNIHKCFKTTYVLCTVVLALIFLWVPSSPEFRGDHDKRQPGQIELYEGAANISRSKKRGSDEDEQYKSIESYRKFEKKIK